MLPSIQQLPFPPSLPKRSIGSNFQLAWLARHLHSPTWGACEVHCMSSNLQPYVIIKFAWTLITFPFRKNFTSINGIDDTTVIGFLEAMYYSCWDVILAYLLSERKSFQLEPRKKRRLWNDSKVQQVIVLCHLGHVILQIQWYLTWRIWKLFGTWQVSIQNTGLYNLGAHPATLCG